MDESLASLVEVTRCDLSPHQVRRSPSQAKILRAFERSLSFIMKRESI